MNTRTSEKRDCLWTVSFFLLFWGGYAELAASCAPQALSNERPQGSRGAVCAVTAAFKSCHSDQKSSFQWNEDFLFIAKAMVYHQPSG
jgi:hypothetical protein